MYINHYNLLCKTVQPLLTLEEKSGSYDEDEEIIEKVQSETISTLKDRESRSNVGDEADTKNIIMKDENDEEENSSHDDLPSKYTDSGVWRNPKRYRDSAKVAREKFPNIEQQMDDLIKDFISNPSCEGERRINAWIEKQISHLRAIKYLQR